MTSSNTKKAAVEVLATRGWISLRQFAQIIEVSYPTVLAMQKRGEISTVKVGGLWRVYTDEVQRFLAFGNLPQGKGEETPPSSV